MFGITAEVFGGWVRAVAAFGLGVLATKGYLTSEMVVTLAGAAGAIGVAIWSTWSKVKA